MGNLENQKQVLIFFIIILLHLQFLYLFVFCVSMFCENDEDLRRRVS